MAYLFLAIFLLAVLVLWSGMLVVFMARTLLRPPRMTDAKALIRLDRMTPTDLGLSFSPMNFTVRDTRSGKPLTLAAWWIPATSPGEKTVVICHGYGDAKVGGIAWAPLWHSMGFHVLAVDLRAHGESDGVQCTAGYYERDDLDAILNALRLEKPAATRTLALFGASLGAAVVAATAARRTDIAAVVMESPYVDYRSAVRVHLRRRGYPLVSFSNAVCRVAEWMSGADFRVVRPSVLVPRIAAALWVVYGDADPLIDGPAMVTALRARPAESVTRHDVLAGVPHVMGLAHDPDGYAAMLKDFLDAALVPSSEMAESANQTPDR